MADGRASSLKDLYTLEVQANRNLTTLPKCWDGFAAQKTLRCEQGPGAEGMGSQPWQGQSPRLPSHLEQEETSQGAYSPHVPRFYKYS